MVNKLQLQDEQKYYENNESTILEKYKNKYIIIKNNEILGDYDDQYDAYAAGVKKLGNEPFLIKFVTDIPKAPEHAPALWVGSITTR